MTHRIFELNEQTLSIIEEIGGHMPGGFFIYMAEKPETLIKAIRDAQGAASFMDWKAGLISEKEYEAEKDKTFEVKVKDARGRDDAR